jgi:hypothetical protein
MVRGSARNSVVGRAESLRSTSGAREAGQGGIERRTIRAGPERDGRPRADGGQQGWRRVKGKGAQSGICQCCSVCEHLVASHDVARLLARGCQESEAAGGTRQDRRRVA